MSTSVQKTLVMCLGGEWDEMEFNIFVMKEPEYNIMVMQTY